MHRRAFLFRIYILIVSVLVSSLLLNACQSGDAVSPGTPTAAGEQTAAPTAPPAQSAPDDPTSTPTLQPSLEPTAIPAVTVVPQLVWFYKPPSDDDLANIAASFSFGILSNGNEAERDQLMKLGMPGPFLQYLRFDVIQDPGSCSRQPWKNQVANQAGDYCRLSQEHPDWFLHDKNGELLVNPYGGEDFIMMDPGNKFWRAFFVERALQAQQSGKWDGLFLDNVEVSFMFRENRNQFPSAYPTEESYTTAIQDFLEYIHIRLAAKGKLLFANLISRRDDSEFTNNLNFLDGAMHEGWAIDWPTGYRDAKEWETQMRLAEDTQALGKTILLVSQGKIGQEKLQRFAYASYLLVMQGRAYFRYANSSNYREAWLYPNYQQKLGQPLGPRYQVGDPSEGAWRRDFANGWVEVNPVDHTATIELTSP